jgi:hypothetical protein
MNSWVLEAWSLEFHHGIHAWAGTQPLPCIVQNCCTGPLQVTRDMEVIFLPRSMIVAILRKNLL